MIGSDYLVQMFQGSNFWVPMLLLFILAEEYVFRSYMQRTLFLRFSLWATVALQAFAFAIWGYLFSPAVDGFVMALVLGVYLGALRNAIGLLWVGIAVRISLVMLNLALQAESLRVPEAFNAVANFIVIAALLAVYFGGSWLVRSRTDTIYRFLALGQKAAGNEGPITLRASGRTLSQRGIMYDSGVSYAPGHNSFPGWNRNTVQQELQSIADELHCNAVTIIGDDLSRLRETAEIACQVGLMIWIQPREVDSTPEQMLARLAETAKFSEQLRARYGHVCLNVGCEYSIFVSGSIPGADFNARHRALGWVWLLLPLVNLRLNRLLKRAARTAREHFNGTLGYGAGAWEDVDWRPFDVVSLDYYLDSYTWSHYVEGLRRLQRHGKPVVIAEFGCCAYRGAPWRGGGGGWIQNWNDINTRYVKQNVQRDERVQAEYIERLLNFFTAEEVLGAYVCMYAERDQTYSTNARYDLDVASLGIMRANEDGTLVPKEAFHRLAAIYGRAS